MNPRNPNPTVDPTGTLQSSDFLTDEDMHSETPVENTQPIMPDVHKMDSMPNPLKRAEIHKRIDKQFSKLDTVEEAIQRDVVAAQQKKFVSIAKNPKDILKELIAQSEYSEEFKLFGHMWTIRAIDQGDVLLALDEIKDTLTTQAGRTTAYLFGTVAYSIEAIDGISVYEWFDDIKLQDYGNDQMQYFIAVRRALAKYLKAMGSKIIDEFYERYIEVETKRNAALEELKNS